MKDKNKMMPLNLQLFAEDPGDEANTNDGGQENQNTQDNNGSTQEPKTFTQKDVDKIVQGRIAKESPGKSILKIREQKLKSLKI